MNPNEPINAGNPAGSPTSTSPDSIIAGLEEKVAAEKAAQDIGVTPAEPLSSATVMPEPAVNSPTGDFLKQFGDPIGPVQPPVAEGPISTNADLTDVKPPVVDLNSTGEAAPKTEQNLNEKVIQQIKDVLANYDLKEKEPEEVAV